MKNISKIKAFVLSAGLVMTISGIASAKTADVSIVKNIEEGKVTVTAFSAENDLVTLHILPDSITPEMVETTPSLGSDSAYVENKTADDTGKTTFDIRLKNGNYMLYVASVETDEIYSAKLMMADTKTYGDLIKLLQSCDKTNFINTVKDENNKELLGFNIDIYSENAVERFYDEYKNKLSETDYEENLKSFKKCAIAESINAKKDVDYAKYAGELFSDDEEFLKYLDKYITSDEAKEYFGEKIIAEKLDDTGEIETAAKKALILAAVKYTDEPIEIKDVMSEYKDILGISSVSEYASVYRTLAGESFDNIDEFLDAYEVATGDNKKESGGGSSGGSNKGSGSVKPQSGAQGVILPPATAGQMSDVEIFTDIDNVEWAKDAIEGLYKKGIVAGKGDKKFCPQDYVKREEFVKMLVETFGLTLKGNEMSFSDVKEGAWYYDYIRIAHLARSVNGISSEYFGVGQNITRQDICTMIVRTLNECDIILPAVNEKMSFTDEAEIAPYAKEAVFTLQQAGIISGTDTGSFNPQSFATRAETAKIMYGILKFV